MLFQIEVLFFNILWLILAAFLLTFATFGMIIRLISKEKAFEKKYMIILTSFLITLFLSLFLGIISLLLGLSGDGLILLRFDGGGNNYLISLTSIFGLLFIMIIEKYFLDISWESSLWLSIVLIIILFIIYSFIPEYYIYTSFGL
jgi:hypothetical protein